MPAGAAIANPDPVTGLYTVPELAAVDSCAASPLGDAIKQLGVGDVKLLTGTPLVALVIMFDVLAVSRLAGVDAPTGVMLVMNALVVGPANDPRPLLLRGIGSIFMILALFQNEIGR